MFTHPRLISDYHNLDKADRSNEGKNVLDEIPVRPLWELGKVFSFGAEKYSKGNWKKGREFSTNYGAALRHLLRWQAGEDLDPESGLNHLGHVAWNIITLLEYQLQGREDLDDRQKGQPLQ